MSFFGQMNLMDPATPIQEEMILFHDHVMVCLVAVFVFVVMLGLNMMLNKLSSRTMVEAQVLETIWTIIPAFILVFLALPSLRLLYLLDETYNIEYIVKSTAHQWYWSYDIPYMGTFDSYMTPLSELKLGDYRLLEVDNQVSIPYLVNTCVLTTSADVLHAFAVPSMGVKMDAVPGRINSMSVYIKHPGVYYGQCSEICGANHSFMPIVIEAINLSDLYFDGRNLF